MGIIPTADELLQGVSHRDTAEMRLAKGFYDMLRELLLHLAPPQRVLQPGIDDDEIRQLFRDQALLDKLGKEVSEMPEDLRAVMEEHVEAVTVLPPAEFKPKFPPISKR